MWNNLRYVNRLRNLIYNATASMITQVAISFIITTEISIVIRETDKENTGSRLSHDYT